MIKISAITIVQEVKKIYQNNIVLVRKGGFYRVYGKDAYILSNLFNYKINQEKDVVTCGFPSLF